MPANKISNRKPAGSYRILHTADWHLGKRLNDQSRDEEHARFLDWLLAVVREHAVDAILLAGDVFDSANPPQSALARYYDFVSSLNRQGDCALVVLAGNHDSPAQLEAPKQVLQALNTHVAGFLAEDPAKRILCLPDETSPRIAIALVPFLRDRDIRTGRAGESADEIRTQVVAGIRQCYKETAEAAGDKNLSCPVIATGHLTVLGSRVSDSERDIHIGGLGEFPAGEFPGEFLYIALGHLHRPQMAKGDDRVRYAGSPIALSFSEASDTKQVRILDVTGEDVVQSGLPVPVWRRLAQLHAENAGLEQALSQLDPGPAELRAWVEVVVEDAALEDDLNERVRVLAGELDFDVLKVLRGRPTQLSGINVGQASDDEAIESLLDEPARVFEHLLDEHGPFDEAETGQLKAAFAQLIELDTQSTSEQS